MTTTIKKVYAELGFEGTLRWIEEKHDQKLSLDLETITREMHIGYLRDVNEHFKRSAAKQKYEAKRAVELAKTAAWLARRRVLNPENLKSPESLEDQQARIQAQREEAADLAQIRARQEEALRAIRESQAKAREQDKMFEEIIDAGYKVLAKKRHPDVGGSDSEMQKLSTTRATLKRKLRQ